MKVLLTGASGFFGKILIDNLVDLELTTLSRSNKIDINCDLSKEIPILDNYEIVIHAAGKAHSVPRTEKEKQEFFDVNVKGTENLLIALEKCSVLPKSFVFISSVSVYGLEKGLNIHEETALSAIDPYGESKIQGERMVKEWCTSNGIICTILRLPLLAGPNPPGNLGAMIKGIRKKYYFNIGGGGAKKSIVLVKDVAIIIPLAAQIGGIYNLTDGVHPSFFELSTVIAKQLNCPKPLNIPYWFGKFIAMIGDVMGSIIPINSTKFNKIISDLTFDDTRARQKLNWKPDSVLKQLKIK